MVERALTVGVLTPHVTPGPEIEIPTMSSGQVETLVSRIAPPDGSGLTPPQRRRGGALLETVDAAAAVFTAGSVDALAYTSTSSAYAVGSDREGDLVRRLQDRWQLPVVSS